MIAASQAPSRIVWDLPRHDPATIVTSFIRSMEAAGMRPVDPIGHKLAAGGLVRFRCEGDGPGRLNGRAVLHLDKRPAGWFQHMARGVEGTWKADAPPVYLTATQRAERAREWNVAKAARARAVLAGHVEAAGRAEALWQTATPDYAAHPYLARKRLNPPGLRVHGGALLVPMRDPKGRLWNVQRIAPDGSKRFLPGARVAGLAWHAGVDMRDGPAWPNPDGWRDDGGVLAIGEGMATMAAVHAATGLPVMAALSLSNLSALAGFRVPGECVRHDEVRRVLCADDDAHRPDNPGLAAANAAARACGGLVARPPRPPGWPEGKGWDFADTWAAPGGATRVRAALTLDNGGAR